MTIHALTQYFLYLWKAKGRHGIHSPFVYSFIEDVLQDRKKIFKENKIQDGFLSLEKKYGKLVSRINTYYGYYSFLFIPIEEKEEKRSYDMLLFKPVDPALWEDHLNKYRSSLKNNSTVFIPGIHTTRAHTEYWNKLRAHPKALLSIDLYGAGLLFFKEEFRERQHFVLRY